MKKPPVFCDDGGFPEAAVMAYFIAFASALALS